LQQFRWICVASSHSVGIGTNLPELSLLKIFHQPIATANFWPSAWISQLFTLSFTLGPHHLFTAKLKAIGDRQASLDKA